MYTMTHNLVYFSHLKLDNLDALTGETKSHCQTLIHFYNSESCSTFRITPEEGSVWIYYVLTLHVRISMPGTSILKVDASACVHLTESDRVCVSEFCRRCWGVLKENEGEEWGLSKAWGRRRSRKGGRGGRDEWDHLVHKHKRTYNLTSL